MNEPKPKKQMLAIVAVPAAGFLLGAAILTSEKTAPAGDGHGEHQEAADDDEKGGQHADEHDDEDGEAHDEARAEPAKGPHGGKLLRDGRYAVEVTIFETGVEPQFRLYPYLDGKPLAVDQSQVEPTLERLGQPAQVFKFEKEKDYLKGDAVVVEPHSFAVKVRAVHDGKTYQFGYEQAEARVAMTDAQLQGGRGTRHGGPATIGTTLRLLGEVRYNSDRTVQVVPRRQGWWSPLPPTPATASARARCWPC